jgi:hypothetical protein
MKFSKLLHPEIVLGRRGPRKQVKGLKEFIDSVSMSKHPDDEGIRYALNGVLGSFIKQDPNLADHICMLAKFRKEKPQVYHVGTDFGEVLANVSKDLPLDKLPKNFFGYIHFPENTVRDESDYVIGAYVYIGKGNETPLGDTKDRDMQMIWVSYVQKNPFDDMEFSVCRLVAPITGHKDLKDMVSHTPFDDTVMAQADIDYRDARMPVYRFVINAVLYIHCQEPNLEDLRPKGHLSHGAKRKLANRGYVNLCTVPIVAINWGFKRDRQYSVSETWVNDFYRWQRCGPQFSEIKLTRVKGHTRKYGGKDESKQGDSGETEV